MTKFGEILQEIYAPAMRNMLEDELKVFRHVMGFDEPTEEERARWRRRRENEKAFWDAQEKKHADNPIMQLHYRHGWQCQGCDVGGYEGEPPEWPCRTVRLICTGDPDFVFEDDNVIDS